jgi:hypothetical protein
MKKMTGQQLIRARELLASATPLDGEVLESMRSDGLSIDQDPVIPSNVFELSSGRTGVALNIFIYNGSRRIIRLDEPRIDIPWCPRFSWLPNPLRKVPREYAYFFPTPPHRGFPCETVLNHHFQQHRRLLPGGFLEGALLGIGEGSIPDEYHDRQRLRTWLLIFDGRGENYDLTVHLMIERERKRRPANLRAANSARSRLRHLGGSRCPEKDNAEELGVPNTRSPD